MRGRGEIASAHDLTPEKVLVTWLREEAEVAAASQEEPGNVCIELSCFGICVTQNWGENILPLSRACFSLSLQILKHTGTPRHCPLKLAFPQWVGQWVWTHQRTSEQDRPRR